MLKDEKVKVKVSNKTLLYYSDFFSNLKVGDEILISSTLIQNGSSVLITGICDFCNKEKIISKKSYNQQTKNSKEPFTCSKKCAILKRKKTCLDKYGEENVFSLDGVKEKYKNTLLKKYGVDNPSKSEKIIDKRKKTCLDRYGYDSASKSELVKKKVIYTNINKFGVEFPSKSDVIKNKMCETTFKRYGVDNFSKTSIFKEKIKLKCLEKMAIKLSNSGTLLTSNDSKYLIKCKICKNDFQILNNLMNSRIRVGDSICLNCNPKKQKIKENKIYSFIEENYSGKIIQNDRSILNGKELDIYLPDLNLAFEFNGLYWHSDIYKDRMYHINKTKECLDKGIQLIHIWEDDWNYKPEIVKSIILNKLKLSKRIFARKCEIKIPVNKEVKEFLTNNHIQGFVGSRVKIGLYFEGELVSLMTFGNLRKSLGQKYSENTYELLRFCNKLGYSVVGGASKLFNYFAKNYEFNEIISYSDNSRGVGNLYKKLGFELIHETFPNYYWIVDGIRKHRFNFRKDKLVKEGNDSKKTEVQIMNDKGYNRIFDCGNKKWIKKSTKDNH